MNRKSALMVHIKYKVEPAGAIALVCASHRRFLLAWWTTVILSACLLAGCGKNEAKANLDMDKLQASFASSDPEIKAVIDKSVADSKAANYRRAFDGLVPLLKNPRVTSEQIDALRESMHQLSLLFPPPNPSMAIPKS